MMCHWCDNPKDLEEETYDRYCHKCHRYSKPVPVNYSDSDYLTQQGDWNPLEYLKHHACVWNYTFGEYSIYLKCVNPVRWELSDQTNGEKCTKRLTLTYKEWEAEEPKRELTKKIHSYQFLEDIQIQWTEIKAKKASIRNSKRTMTEEEILKHPKYEEFLKLQERTKV